jgi:hypothetical protein
METSTLSAQGANQANIYGNIFKRQKAYYTMDKIQELTQWLDY